MESPPKVFISHASEDKERFVLPFAERLRANGVDAWVDRWEMLPGDSLIDKVFEEGIKNAQAMVVVLSHASVNKRWVREELNAGMVKRISDSTRIIPVLIDDCDVPEALQSTLWERIPDLDTYDAQFERILAAIFSITDKPPIGPAPGYTALPIATIHGLTKIDTMVLKVACEESLQKGIDWITLQDISAELTALGVATEDAYDAIEVLDEAYLIEGKAQLGGRTDFFRITTHGFETFAAAFMPEFASIVDAVLLAIVNRNLLANDALAAQLAQPKVIIDYALDVLSSHGLIKVTKTMGGGAHVHDISVRARRAASEIRP